MADRKSARVGESVRWRTYRLRTGRRPGDADAQRGPSLLSSYAAISTFWNLALALGMVLVIAIISGYIGVRKVLRIKPFGIFRG
jgi:ABC-type antimicrobial peptide transport system permease subunit